ncbi:MAG: D-tyrosyl-tRNA(Tyr) deacylase, partial [Euryarchaeota archaeon]|nr:D-tyrosyl-tRNA(Tyr) deacylase [Euryarchaeota archaeon]
MRAVIQRVKEASVTVDGRTTGSIDRGYLILLGVEDADHQSDVEWLANKVAALRIFSDEDGLMNRSITDVDGQVLVVSQF